MLVLENHFIKFIYIMRFSDRPEELIGADDVTESNAMQYLAAIEQKASKVWTEIRGDDSEEQENHNGTSPSKHEVDIVHLMLPSAYNSQEDNDERPFTMKELQESLQTLE